MNVYDASALLVFLQGEPGADVLEAALEDGGACSAVNWSETVQKVYQRGADWSLARALLLGYGLTVEPVVMEDAERAADLWRATPKLSLGDRLCLALAERRNAVAWTSDAAWGSSDTIRQVRPGSQDSS